MDSRLTRAEIDSIAQRLTPDEAVQFRRWADRMARGQQFGGEGIARTVRDALLSQQTYDAKEAEQEAQVKRSDKLRREREEAEKAAAKARIAEHYAHRQAVHRAISEYVEGTIVSYTPKTFYDRSNRPIGGTVEFIVKLTNKANHTVIGIAGVVGLNDVFGTDLGTYPFAIEPRIEANKSLMYKLLLNFDPRNEQHQAIWRANSLNHVWFFESAAFENGIRLDASTIPRNNGRFDINSIPARPKQPST